MGPANTLSSEHGWEWEGGQPTQKGEQGLLGERHWGPVRSFFQSSEIGNWEGCVQIARNFQGERSQGSLGPMTVELMEEARMQWRGRCWVPTKDGDQE